jgi:catechol 2,3-dioxygenase-like lactoylglutathione lyase family enzyme
MDAAPRAVEVIGIDHIYIAVRDLERSERYYDTVMRILDFRKVARPLAGGDMHVHYYNRVLQFSLRPASAGSADHDSYAPGLHHFCFRVAENSDVDAVAAQLTDAGIEATSPRSYPEYQDDYYASFFTDPDGVRLEVVNYMEMRKQVVDIFDRIPAIDR